MSAAPPSSRHWITHRYFRTYEIAGQLTALAHAPTAYLNYIEDLTINDGALEFLQNWSKDTVVHKFAKWIAHTKFLDDTNGPYVTIYSDDENGGYRPKVTRFLPVDLALRAYGLSAEAFAVPSPDGELVRIDSNITSWQESTKVADACHYYFTECLMHSQEYDNLLDQIADEVFHLTFLDRGTLAGLNEILTTHMQGYGGLAHTEYAPAFEEGHGIQLDALFTAPRLTRLVGPSPGVLRERLTRPIRG